MLKILVISIHRFRILK